MLRYILSHLRVDHPVTSPEVIGYENLMLLGNSLSFRINELKSPGNANHNNIKILLTQVLT